MTDHPHEGRRSRGENSGSYRAHVNRSGDPRGGNSDYVLRSDGTPLVDRYGRPVRRRPTERPRAEAPRPAESPDATRVEQPRRRPRRSEPPRPGPAPQQRQQPQQHLPPQRPQPRYQPPRQDRYAYPPQQPPQAPAAPQAPARPYRKKRRGPGCLGCFGWVLATLVVAAIVLVLFADARLTRVEAMPDQQLSDTAGTNWLLVGSDSRQGLSDEEAAALGTGGDMGSARTDTIMLLHIPPGGGDARLVSLPRDSLVEIPGYGENKINAAFTFGGPQLLTATVEQNTGMRIDHYAEIGMGGLANLTDAVGGVEICVAEPIYDPLANLDVQAGCQTMDGPTALGYVRTRATAQGDLDRVMRQREFFASLLSEITSPATLLNPFEALPLMWHGSRTFTVGEGTHVWHLARLALAMAGDTSMETVPVGGFIDTSVGNVVIWDDYGAEELFGSMR